MFFPVCWRPAALQSMAAGVFLGAFGATLIAVGAVVSIFGNLNGGFLATTRMPYAMAEQKGVITKNGAVTIFGSR